MAHEVNGILVSMSAGLYVPVIQTVDYTDPSPASRYVICDYGSTHALEAGLSNPKHWAHAVYRTLERLCAEHQKELQGGSMDAYEETRLDREEAERARQHGYGD